MSEPLEFDGERFTPENEREIWYEHMHRYAFAARYVRGMDVLDAACGEGYGAAILARAANSVTGVDNSARAIEHARKRYPLHNAAFREADIRELPFGDQCFDCIISFETIEHLEDQDGMLREFRRVLRPTGFLVISSPDKAVYSDEQNFDNPHHVRELYADEFRALLDAHFPARRLFGQKLMFHSAIWSIGDTGSTSAETGLAAHLQNAGKAGPENVDRPVQKAMYLIAMCALDESHLPSAENAIWLFDDEQESVYRHYHHEIRKNMQAGAILAERDEALKQAQAALAAADSQQAPRRNWLSRLGLSRRGRD